MVIWKTTKLHKQWFITTIQLKLLVSRENEWGSRVAVRQSETRQ